MPFIQIDGPQIPIEKKRQLSQEITEIVSRIYGIPREAGVFLLIKENNPDCIALGGKLICDVYSSGGK